jgi:hypothetical protein
MRFCGNRAHDREKLADTGLPARDPAPNLLKMNRSIMTTFIDQRFSTAC